MKQTLDIYKYCNHTGMSIKV